MNPIPFLGLGMIAAGYMAATDAMDAQFADAPVPQIAAYDAGGNFSVYDLPGAEHFDSGEQAFDQPFCEAHDEITATLDADFAETRVADRVTSGGLQVELYASDVMGTWTVVHRGDDGISCIVSSGTGWTPSATPEMVFDEANLAS